MRFVLSLASLLTVTLLIFNGYANGSGDSHDSANNGRADPVTRAKNVNIVIEDTAALQREALEKQLQ